MTDRRIKTKQRVADYDEVYTAPRKVNAMLDLVKQETEQIGKILKFYRDLNIRIISSVPTEKIEAIAHHMDCINLVIRHGFSAKVRDFHSDENTGGGDL